MTDNAELFVDCRCELGEGPFWNGFVQRLFWFDILNQTLYSARADGHMVDRFTFESRPSAGVALDADTLAVVTSTGVVRFSLSENKATPLMAIEAENAGTRSNDSRVHPAGGYWIGTMGLHGNNDPGAGSLYMLRDGTLETLLHRITIPNSICFSPDGSRGYFADTGSRTIRTVALDPTTGRPVGPWTDFASTAGHRGLPDGSVVDAEGYLWNARWGGSCVVRHAPDGSVDRIVELPVSRVTCPAFGGADLKTLYITTAREHMTPEELEREPLAGSVFAIRTDVPGQPDPVPKL